MIKLLFLFLAIFSAYHLRAQEPPFFKEIQAFKHEDSLLYPPKNAILFTGSSSFTKWKDAQSYFPGYPILNRAFGGSTLPDLIRYAADIIIPYHPKQVVIYCGDNDLASSDTITPGTVFYRFQKLFFILRNRLPEANITYVSIKPSPSRARLMPQMRRANMMIEVFLKSQKNTAFINVFQPMLEPRGGKPKPEIFLEDSLHMNEKGYAIWQRAIEPYLVK